MNLLAQLFAVIALVFMYFSYQKKSKKDFLYLQIFMNIFFGLQYFLLRAFSALVSNIVTIIKTVIFYRLENKGKNIGWQYLVIFEIFIIAFGVITYNGILSIIPILIAFLYTYGTWQKNLKLTYKIAIIAAVLWIFYNFLVGAYVSTVGSVIELIASSKGFISLKRDESKKEVLQKTK